MNQDTSSSILFMVVVFVLFCRSTFSFPFPLLQCAGASLPSSSKSTTQANKEPLNQPNKKEEIIPYGNRNIAEPHLYQLTISVFFSIFFFPQPFHIESMDKPVKIEQVTWTALLILETLLEVAFQLLLHSLVLPGSSWSRHQNAMRKATLLLPVQLGTGSSSVKHQPMPTYHHTIVSETLHVFPVL